MGNSMGCVRPPQEGQLRGAPPLSPKKRLRFRRKHKGKKNRKGESDLEDSERRRSHEPDEREEEEEDDDEKVTVIETADSDFSSRAQTLITVPDSKLIHSKTNIHSNTLSPGSLSANVGGLLGSRLLEVSPKPSPAWRGVFCLPGEEDTVSAIIDVSSIPSQTTTTTPVNTAPALGSTTPGGGRVCRVREKVQGVLEKPWILRQKKEKRDKGRLEREEKVDDGVKGGPEGTLRVDRTPSGRERKGVVHIREVDGKLCVVRTVYPSDFGSPVWRGESDSEVDVYREPNAPSPVTGNILKVQLLEVDKSRAGTSAVDFPMSSNQMRTQETMLVKGFNLDTPGRALEQSSLLESGYASDLPLTSPETAGTTPSQTDWGGLTSSSSERLDSMMESPLSVQTQATVKYLPQISEIYVSGESGDLTAKEKLLIWSQQATEGYPGLRCVNFTSSWSDGRMFNALLHRYRPDLIDMETLSRQSNRENLEQAFEIAESLGVTRLLDAEDVDVPSPDEKSVITYVSSIYDAFPKIPEGGEGIAANEVDQRWSEYQSRFSSLLQWSRQHTALMANKNFPQNPVELKALYNEYVHFKETEIPAKEIEKGHIEHLYKLLEVWIEFGRIKLPPGLHPNDLEEEWGKLILEMLEREKALRPAVERLELLLQRANKIQNMALDCEEKLTLAKNTLQADMSRMESGEAVQCERELACYLQDCESLIRQLNQELKVLRDEKYYQVEQLAFRVSCLQEELVSLRLQCSSVYRKGHFSQALGSIGAEHTSQRASDSGLTLGQTLLGAVGAVGAVGAALLRRPMARSQLVAMSSSEDEGSLRFIYELLGWVEETQELLERAEWGADLPTVENNLKEHNTIHTAVEELMSSLQEARSYEAKVSPNFKNNYSETLAKLEHQYCKLLEHSSWRLRSLESLHAFVSHCTEELIWLNEREEEEIAFDWSDNNPNMNAKKELYSEMRLELDEKQEVMRSLQETANRLCQENHPAKQTVEAYSAALQTQWQWVNQLCVCVEQHLKDNTAYFQFMSDSRDCESYLRQLQETIKRQYTCDKNSRLSKLEDLLQDSMEEKEQLIEYRSTVASLVGRAKTLVQLHPRSAESTLGTTTPIKAICDYRQIETNVQITITRGEECVLEDNTQRTKWKVISPTGNEAMVPSVCFTVPPPNQEAMDTASRTEQLYQKVMSLWHQLHINMKSVVSWHYLLKDIRTVSGWNLDMVRCQSPAEREQVLGHLESQLADFLSDSKESALFTPGERRELEKEVQQAQQHCQNLLLNMETVEKDESVSRSYLSELQNITLRLNEAEQRLLRGIETPPPSRLSGDSTDITVQITEQEKLQSELDTLRSSLGDVSRRCVSFFEEKSTSSSVPVLRSELNQAVEKTDKLHNLSSVYLEKLKTVEILMRGLDEAESLVRKNESRLSEEDIVPADTTAIQNLRDQLEKWQSELTEQEDIFQSLQSQVGRAKEAASRLSRLHPDRSPEMERYQERANQMAERWSGIKRQMEIRQTELEALGSALQQYRDGHSALIKWIEETTERQENTQPGQTDSKALSEQLAQQTALVAEIEQNQTKLDECQTHSKQYCTSVKDYELQLMTYRAFVESTHKSPVKRRRMHSSSDAITQEFMDLRTRYTALVTLTTQHVKYISDALRRLEEEEKEVEEEKQARVGQVSDLLGWVKGLQGRTGGPNAESSLAAQQAISEQLAAKKDEVAEAIRSTQVFLLSKQASKLSLEERANVEAQLDELTATYNQLCDSSTQQLQQLEQQLAKEEERKKHLAIAGVIDLGTVETFPVFQAAKRGLIDQDTCHVLLEAQLIMGGLLQPDSPHNLSLEQGLAQGFIDTHTRQSLSELQNALVLVENSKSTDDQQQNVLPVATAMEVGLIGEEVGLRILELQMNTGGLRDSAGQIMSLEQAEDKRLLTPRVLNKLQSRLQRRELINPNTAEKLNLYELQQRCVHDSDSGLLLFPVEQQPGGTVCLRSGRKVGIFRAVQEGLIDRKVTVRLLEAQLFGGGIADPRSGHRLTIEEAVRHGLLDQDLACAMLARQLQNGGILDPLSGERLDLEESIRRDLLSSRLAVLVLESLWAFMGILWPESGELLPIVEAFQQGVISGELSRNILRQRHAIGALYNPETLQVLPLNQAAEEALEPSVISSLKDIHIPDVLTSMNQSGTPSLNRLSWGSTSSTPPPSSPSPSSSTEGPVWDSTPTQGIDPEEQAKHKLLFHLMTHSYVDAHTGKRLVLLDSELVELVKATELVARDSVYRSQVEPQTSLTRDEQGKLQMVRQFSLKAKTLSEKHHEVEEESSNKVTLSKEFEMNGKSSQKERYDGENDNMPHKPSETVERDLAFGAKNEIDISKDAKVKAQKKEISDLESLTASAEHLKGELTKGRKVSVATESKPRDTDLQETTTTVGRKTVTTPLKSEGDLRLLKESVPKVAKTNEDAHSTQSDDWKGVKYSQTESGKIKQKVPITETDSKHAEPQIDVLESPVEKEEEDAKLRKLVLELKQGGLMTDEGERLLPDEAVAQGVLPGHTAVKLMAQAGLFGGFIDASSGESLSMEDVMQEGLLDEDLMWSVLKSDKTLAGVVDVDKRQICGVREAAQAGMIDPNTAARLLEAQVASGGIVDLRRDKKVSVTLAANLGLIEENQRDELMALEKAYKGKDTDSATALTKASLQLQMEGVIDPESKSPVPLEQAIQKGLIQSKEAYQVLARQVAEGGIVHHASGLRLSVSDAVDRGLVDRSIAPGLEELEWVYQGRVSPSSHPEAVNFQASTGAILDPESGCKLTLTEAVSKGLLDEDIASEAMASSTVTQGVLDPQTARIVPYLELVNQGTIDIETGKRFLEVKPFRGVHDVQTRENLTVPEAVASKQVDPVPALRLLQSQANSGGIIDISTGERLPLMEACNRGLVGDKMVREIAINQFLKGGLVDPATGQQVSSLNDAIAKGLISRDIASDIQEKLAFVEMEVEEGSATPVASSSDTYSPSIIMSVSCPDSPENLSDVNTERSSTSTLSKTGSEITDDDGKTLTSVVSDQSTLYDPTEEDKVEVPVEEKTSVEPDQSLDLLSKFAINVEKRIQKTIEEIVPQEDTNKPEPLPTQKLDEKLQTGKSQTNKKQKGKDLKDSVAESIQTSVHDTDKNSQEQKGDTILKSKDTRDDRQSKGSTELSQWSEEVLRKIDVAAQKDDDVDESGTRVETEKPLEVEIKSITDVEQSDDILTSRVTQSKSKKKRKNKKNGKGKEAESETLSPEIEHLSQIDQADAHIEWQTEAIVVTNEPVSQEKNVKSQIGSQADSTRPPSGQSEVKDKKKIEAENNLVKQGQEAGPATLEFTEDAIEPEKDVVKTIMLKDTEGGVKKEKMTREHQKVKVGEKVSVSQQPEQTDSSQEVKKNKEQELPQKSNLPDNEKAALILKAKESILKKVFEKGVSEKQTAEELQALRSEVTKKESRGTSVEDVKTPTLPSKIDGVESHDVKDDGVKRPSGPPRDKEEELSVKEHKMGLMGVKEDTAVEQRSVKEDRETKLLEVSSDEREHKMGFGKEDIQNNIEATPSLQPKETQQSKRSRKNKKSKSQKMTDKTEPDIETILTPEKDDSEVTSTKMITKSAMTEDQRMDGYSNSESASDVIRPIVGKEANEEETSENDAKEAETSQQSQINLHQSEEPSSPSEEHIESTEATSEKEESQESPLETKNAGESIDGSQEITTCKPDIQPTAQSMVPGTQTGKKTGKSKKKKKLQPEVKSVSVAESKSLKDQQQNLESPGSAEEASTESDSPKVPESDTATESWKEGEDDVRDSQEVIKEVMTPKTGKSSLIRQECLEHDQQIVALVSMVRHIEVRLKQQQQQSVGRSLIALDDIIRQTETLDLELRDLEPAINKEVEAAEQLLKPKPKDVPPQLLLALEKDGRSLARGYEAARALSMGILQSLQDHRDSYKEAVTAEQKSLGGQVESLLSWLRETEARMNGGMAGMEKMEKAEKDDSHDQLTQQLSLCKELQSSLMARSNEVNNVAFDIQVFISERAQDLAPEQSRQLLGQLQQLQRAFHQASGQAQAWAEALSAQREREEEWQRRERVKEEEKDRERQSAREREVVQQQKAECSQKLEGLSMWLAGAASLLASQKAGAESDDVNVLQEKQKKLKEVEKDLKTKREGIAEAIRSVEELLAERGESLSPEERKKLQEALATMKEQYGALTDSVNTSLTEVNSAINTTVQQNTQRAKAEEELQETQGQIDSLLNELSSLSQPGGRGVGSGVTRDVVDIPFSQPGGAVLSHTEMLQAELQQLQSQQAQLLQITQSTRSLLEQPDSTVPPEEKQRLRAALDQLQAQHQDRLQSCQDRLRKSEALKDELAKFLQEHGGLGTWLEQSEQELRSLGEGETDAQGLKGRLEEHRKLAEDVICHKADLRFVSISGQKVLDSIQAALEQVGGSDPAMNSTKQLVTDKLQDANHRYTNLHTKSTELGGRLSGLLERYQQYQDEVVSLHSWLSTQEQNQSIAKPSGETDPQNLQNTLRQVQMLQDELAERSVQLEKVKRAGRDLVSTDESPSLKAVDILCAADGLEKRFGSLSSSVSERAEQLQTAVAQSVSVQEGLKGLLSWLDKLVVNPGPVEATAQAVQDALTQNQKLRQELLSRQGSVEATRDSVSKLLQSADASTASGLQGPLDELTQRYAAAQTSQAEREAELKGLLPRLESYERLGTDLQVFTQSRVKALSPAGQPDRSVDDYRQTIEEVRSELEQEASQLKSFCNLGTELSQSKAFGNTQSLLDNVKGVSDEFTQLEANVNERFAAIQACEQQLLQFRGLSGSLLRWLQTAQEQLPSKEASLTTEALQRRVQQLKDLMNDWESQRSRVQELNKTGSELESLIIDITTPQAKTGAPQINGSAGPSSVNGIHTCKDLTELQVAVSDVNGRYEALGGELKERLGRQQASLELRQKARQGTEELKSWLTDREHSLKQGQTASPSRPEVVRAQAQENKALLSELTEHSGKVDELKSTLRKLIADNPDSPEADSWRQQLQEIECRWQTANQAAAQRQTELETCADRLGSFASAASQLGPWLREKELMMSVLGPLSIDPNMLNTQKQQVQFMLREFETRRPQFDQLTQSAEGILSQTGDSSQDPKDLEEVRSELGSISQQWEDLTNRLSQRSNHIDQAQGTSERYQALLRELSSSASALGERLDAQASLSAQPEALKRRLQETGEIRSELERRRTELAEAERLCQELSTIVAEPYLKEELSKRLESVSGPLKSLEERAADGLSQLQTALSSTQQFQQMFEELRSWLDKQADPKESSTDALPCQSEAIRSLLAQTGDLQRGIASQRGSYELIQAEGASLLATLPVGGDERSALQSRLASLRQDWEGLNQRISDRENRLKTTLSKAETYQQHKAELTPWLAECEQKDGEIQPSLDASALDEALQKARGLSLDLERRQPLLEAFNTAADQLLEQCCIGEEEVRDEKAQLNRRVDKLGERLHNHTSQLEELACRLKEFEEGRQAAERRLEAAKHQIEVQEALGPQACSAKSLERLRSQQENLRSLKPQVVYLRDLAQGLVQDSPQTAGGSTEGTQRLQELAKETERDYDDVTEKIEQCCSTLESRLQGVGEVQSHVRDVFSRLADLDDELDSLSPVGRDADSLASQADALKGFLTRLTNLRSELEGHSSDCTSMLRREGSSPDLLALRRETEALNRQAGKLSERGQARLDQIEDAAGRVQEFYRQVAELQGLLGKAEEGLNAQGLVGSEVEMIKQQLQEFKAVEREQVDSIQPKLQHVNAVGQGLIQSAAKHTDTQALEHDLETTNLRWNSLNKRVAERIAQLQEALLHCGKFQDALEPLLSWLSDTEELVANQKPPSAEYRVVKAQIQEQKLLQRLLDDRRPTVEMIRAEGARIAATADTQDREKIQTQLQSLAERWTDLLDKASARQRQLEELQVLALEFHEALEPLGEWLSATERRLSSAEPMGTQTAKITQQIVKHKALQEDVSSREAEVDHLESLSQSLTPLSCTADRDWLSERVGAVRSGHSELTDWCTRRAGLLEQALANAQLFGEDEVEVLNWLAEVAQRLAQVSIQSYQPQLLAELHKHTLSLNEEIVSRKKTVDQAIKNGQALLKQTTGEEVLLIQEKLDGIKSRYAEMTAGSSKALRTLEQALQLSTRFASAHDDVNQWLDSVEAELNNVEPDATPSYQERQKELKKVSAEKRLVLDTVNEVGSALLDLVPWRAREGLDRLVADANQRYRQADETITQRVQLVQAAIQRSQQYEEAVDAELAWVGETERKLGSLGPLSLEPDVTVAQLQVQRAFNIDIIRHKDTVDQLLSTRDDILETCSDAQKDALIVKTDSLSARYDTVSQSHSERFSALEQAQVLVARFWETHEELEPWLGETETLITQLPPPAIDTDALRLQQDQMRLLRESIAEHKPHIDKLLKIGPQLAELSLQEGASVIQRYTEAERRYLAIKEGVKGRATTLDEAVSQSAQLVEFHDKMDPLLETLEGAVQRLRQPPSVAAEVEKIREQLAEHRAQGLELDKLLPSFSALCARGEELIGRAAHDDPAAQAVRSRLLRLRSLWDEIRQRAEEREGKLNDVLDLSGKFWADVAALLSTLRDSQDIVKELEDPGVDPSLIKQQIEAAEAIKAETDGLREELEFVRTLGADLIFACGETEKPEVKKTIDEMNAAWEGLNRTWRERMERLEEAMTASVQYQDALQSMFDYLDNAVIKLCDMSTVGTDLGTVKQQIEELKQYKVEVYQQQIDMEKLCHQGELLLKKVSDQTDRDMIQEPLTELRHLWENLGDKITQRQHKLEAALLALGQFQHALSELQAWLNHTHTTLDTQRPVSSDPKAIEIELAKHHVLRNDVLSHHSTVETVNSAAAELLESSPGDEASHLRDQLDHLNQSWESLLLKTQERQKLLEAALQQAEGFHGELEEFLQWLRRTESQLSAAKPTGGLPETAREQLQQHMELQAQLTQRADLYHRLLDQGESMLLARGGEEAGPGTTQTQQNLAMLQNKWASLNTKMDDRRAKLDEAVSLATGFQTSLQDTINWLTQAEQTLNMAQPPSLMLDTVLFQIDEHKVFVNEVNTHREQVLALEKAGSQLRFASLKQDVVLIKNLLLSVQARWDKLVQRSLDRGRHLDEARKRAKQFHEAWRKLTDWLEEAEKRLDSELEISNEPDKIKVQLAKHKEFQKALGSKQPVYDTTVRSGKAMRDKAQLPADTQKLDHLVGEVRDKWDTVCGKSVERQHKLEEALLFSGQFAEALQALVDWLYRVEPQLAEDQPVHGDLDLVSNLMDSHKAFQKELGKRTSSVQALKRSARDLMDTGRDDTAWVKVQLQELSNRWDTVCALSVTKQTRLQLALKQAEEFRTAVQVLLEWLSEAEQTLRFRGVLPEEAETLQALLHTHRDFMGTVEEKRADVNKAAGMGEGILTVCHPDSITTIKHWITIIRARFEEVLTWAKQHEQRLETALTEVLNNANLLEELLSWLQWSETTLIQRDQEPLPQDIPQLKTLITEHQMFMEEMTRKQPDVDKVTKTYKRKPAEAPSSLAERRGARKHQQQQQQQAAMQVPGGNPRLNQLCARWQQVWLLALDRQRKLNDGLDRLEELKEFANFDFDVWRKKYMRWMNHKKSRVMDFFRRIDKDQDGKITRQEFIDGILASKFPTSKLEMTAVADIFDRDGDGYIDYYEFVAALHPNKDAYRPTTDADKIEDEVTRQVAQCKCAKRFQVEQIGENKYRFGDSQQLRLVRILRSTVMVRVGGGWMALDEFLVKNDPCRVQHPGLKILRSDSSSSISSRIARGRTNLELREKFILPEGASQGLAAFRSRGRRSKPGSRNASPTRSSSSASHSGASLPSAPSAPATPTASASSRSTHTHSRDYAKPWLAHSKTPTPTKCHCCPDLGHVTPGHEGAASGSKLKRPTFHSSRGSLTGENGGTSKPSRTDPKRGGSTVSGPTSRAGSRAGSRASSRRGSDASDASELQDARSVCSDASDTPRRPGSGAKPSKIPTISKKAPSPKTTGSAKK
ncbi:microtubule-actin cross-linking factor 1 isoform X4 [Acanthopagrus latus]|uniref:microtubule-actin cross-linking factor 1 isoform X4 n=1 Tax=Acanthopagrus latus TaxID=8177 RepID=UPI00187C7E22|nr:microtubule-actin cross-linking factor 1 isoform X4 [Acanthopagrus latus]